MYRWQVWADRLTGIPQRLVREMGVPLRGARLGVAQKMLDLVETAPVVDQQAGEGVAQVVEAHIGHACLLTDLIPLFVNLNERLAGLRVRTDVPGGGLQRASDRGRVHATAANGRRDRCMR